MSNENQARHADHDSSRGFWRTRYAIGLLAFGAIALVFLITEHRAHLLGALPFLLLAACPLLHVFMHRGHGSHEHGRKEDLSNRNGVARTTGQSTDAPDRNHQGEGL